MGLFNRKKELLLDSLRSLCQVNQEETFKIVKVQPGTVHNSDFLPSRILDKNLEPVTFYVAAAIDSKGNETTLYIAETFETSINFRKCSGYTTVFQLSGKEVKMKYNEFWDQEDDSKSFIVTISDLIEVLRDKPVTIEGVIKSIEYFNNFSNPGIKANCAITIENEHHIMDGYSAFQAVNLAKDKQCTVSLNIGNVKDVMIGNMLKGTLIAGEEILINPQFISQGVDCLIYYIDNLPDKMQILAQSRDDHTQYGIVINKADILYSTFADTREIIVYPAFNEVVINKVAYRAKISKS